MECVIFNFFIDIVKDIIQRDGREAVRRSRMKRKRRLWVRKWISRRETIGVSNTLFRELETEDAMSFRNILRMSADKFEELLGLIHNKVQKKDTKFRCAIPSRLKLQVTLRFLATGDSLQSLSYFFRIPVCTISTFIPDVLDAIKTALAPYMQVPQTEDEWRAIARQFNQLWNFPRCCGAIDGKHVRIKKPPNSGSDFYNYKGFDSIILFALVDSQYCFRYVNVGSNGRTGDAALFRDSTLNAALEQDLLNLPEEHVILGDDAFPLKTYLLKPYSRARLTKKEKIFNYRLSRARRVVENAFGILAWRFRIFQRAIECKVSTVDKIIWACCHLHNWLRMTHSSVYTPPQAFDTEDFNSGEVFPGLWRDQSDTLINVSKIGSNNYKREAEQIRKTYMEYFCDDGAVPWQWKIVGLESANDIVDESN